MMQQEKRGFVVGLEGNDILHAQIIDLRPLQYIYIYI